jgi:hypothetical protein
VVELGPEIVSASKGALEAFALENGQVTRHGLEGLIKEAISSSSMASAVREIARELGAARAGEYLARGWLFFIQSQKASLSTNQTDPPRLSAPPLNL